MKKLIFAIALVLILSGCVRRLITKQLSHIIEPVQTSFIAEQDVALARQGLPFTIKFAEGLYEYYPRSPYYSGKLCFLYAAYAFAFIDGTPYDDLEDESEDSFASMMVYYDKAYRFGMLSMNARIKDFEKKVLDKEQVDSALAKVKEEDIETLFWLDFAWAMKIFNNTDDTSLVAQLDVVKKISDRIIELDPSYLYGSAYAIHMAFYGGRTAMLGGDIDKFQEAYEKGGKYAADKSLILDFVKMRFVDTQVADSSAFESTFEQIQEFDTGANPEFVFINKVVVEKAAALFQKKDMLF